MWPCRTSRKAGIRNLTVWQKKEQSHKWSLWKNRNKRLYSIFEDLLLSFYTTPPLLLGYILKWPTINTQVKCSQGNICNLQDSYFWASDATEAVGITCLIFLVHMMYILVWVYVWDRSECLQKETLLVGLGLRICCMSNNFGIGGRKCVKWANIIVAIFLALPYLRSKRAHTLLFLISEIQI